MTKVTNEYPYASLRTLVKPGPKMFSKEENRLYDLVDKLKRENEELKLLLKECVENFPTKEFAERVYSIDGIERPIPEPLPLNVDEEIPF